jgi:hypothetical protein
MNMRGYTLLVIFVLACGDGSRAVVIKPSARQLMSALKVGIANDELTHLINTPLFRMKPREVDRYLAYLSVDEPNLRTRVAHLARKNIGQPYQLYLLGEFPYETTDPEPLFSLEKSDCLVFAEHTYAMALSRSWEEFFWMLQRIRYRDGVIGVVTRNHYTEPDWNQQNAWLVKDLSAELAGDRAASYTLKVDRSKFFRDRYKLERAIPIETRVETYVPKEMVAEIASQLQEGDFVNVISTKDGDSYASHVGLVVIGPNGERHFLHSSEPKVREESFESFIRRTLKREARKPDKALAGFKFLRLNDNPEVPPMAPQPRPTRPPPEGTQHAAID